MIQPRDVPQKWRSIQVLMRFALRLLILVIFAMLSSAGFGRSFAALLWMSTIISAVIATMKHEPPFDTVLNHWDETITYAALCMLVTGLNQSL